MDHIHNQGLLYNYSNFTGSFTNTVHINACMLVYKERTVVFDGSTVVFDLHFSRKKTKSRPHSYGKLSGSVQCAVCHCYPEVCVCAYQHVCANLLATVCVCVSILGVMHGQP